MTRIEVVLKDGRGSAFSMDADAKAAMSYALRCLNDERRFITWPTTVGTLFAVAKDQIAVVVVNAPAGQAAPEKQAAPERAGG